MKCQNNEYDGNVVDVSTTEQNWVKIFDTIYAMMQNTTVNTKAVSNIVQFPDVL